MRIFITGATGFIGSAVVQELIAAGHSVTGLARSDTSAAALSNSGADVVLGSLDDHDALRKAADASEGVIHTAHNHDFANVGRDVAAAQDLAAIKEMGQALSGSGHPLIITSATAGPTEDDDGDPGYPRFTSEQATLAMAREGVRSMVMRLPPTVHGAGDENGFIPRLFSLARDKGVSAWIGDGQNRWPSVHRLDAARLFRLALEQGGAGARYHAVDEEGVATKEIAQAIGHRLNLPAVSLPSADAADHFGFLGHILNLDIYASSAVTRDFLNWQPVRSGLIKDIEHGAYGED
jgi:nucleoside-diphosphate-sugar epimerase